MKRLIILVAVCCVSVMAFTTVAPAAPDWSIQFQCTATGANDIGITSLGTMQGAIDGQDSNDLVASLPSPDYVRFVENRPELGGAYIQRDIRLPYENETKVWSNLVIDASLSTTRTVTLSWTPGSPLPAGAYKLVDTADGTESDLSSAGSISFDLSGTGVLKRFYMTAVVGSAPSLYKLHQVADIGKLQSSGSVVAIVGAQNYVYAYFGDEDRRILQVNIETGAPTSIRTAPAAVRSRPVFYTQWVFTVDSAGNLVWQDPITPGSGGSLSATGNPSAVPAVILSGSTRYIFIGTTTGLKRARFSTMSKTIDKTWTLGVPCGSPAVLWNSDLVWCGATNGNLYCLSSDLSVVRAVKTIGGNVSDPMIDPYAGTVSAGGGHSYGIYDAVTFADRYLVPIAGNVTTATYVDFIQKNAFFLSDDNKVNAVNTITGAIPAGWPVALDGTATRSAAPIVGPTKVAVSGGAGDRKLYVITKATSAITALSGNGEFLAAPSWSPDGTKIVVPNTDGNLYVISAL